MTIFWVAAFIALAVLEAATFGLTSIWFCAGALAAMIFSAAGAPFWLQIAAFLAVSAVAMVLLRPVAKRYLTPRRTATNADRVIGREGVVTERVDNLAATGKISVGGDVWTARSESGEAIEKDCRVRILRIEGVKVFVEPMEKAEEKEPSVLGRT